MNMEKIILAISLLIFAGGVYSITSPEQSSPSPQTQAPNISSLKRSIIYTGDDKAFRNALILEKTRLSLYYSVKNQMPSLKVPLAIARSPESPRYKFLTKYAEDKATLKRKRMLVKARGDLERYTDKLKSIKSCIKNASHLNRLRTCRTTFRSVAHSMTMLFGNRYEMNQGYFNAFYEKGWPKSVKEEVRSIKIAASKRLYIDDISLLDDIVNMQLKKIANGSKTIDSAQVNKDKKVIQAALDCLQKASKSYDMIKCQRPTYPIKDVLLYDYTR